MAYCGIANERDFQVQDQHRKCAGDFVLERQIFHRATSGCFVDQNSYIDKSGSSYATIHQDARDAQRYINYLPRNRLISCVYRA